MESFFQLFDHGLLQQKLGIEIPRKRTPGEHLPNKINLFCLPYQLSV